MPGGRDSRRNIDSFEQTLNQNLDRWPEVFTKPMSCAKSLKTMKGCYAVMCALNSARKHWQRFRRFEIQTLYRELLNRKLSGRPIR